MAIAGGFGLGWGVWASVGLSAGAWMSGGIGGGVSFVLKGIGDIRVQCGPATFVVAGAGWAAHLSQGCSRHVDSYARPRDPAYFD